MNWWAEFHYTLAVYLGQNALKKHMQHWEMLWTIALLQFAIITLAVLASMMYNILVFIEEVEKIKNLDQFLSTNMKLYFVLNGNLTTQQLADMM